MASSTHHRKGRKSKNRVIAHRHAGKAAARCSVIGTGPHHGRRQAPLRARLGPAARPARPERATLAAAARRWATPHWGGSGRHQRTTVLTQADVRAPAKRPHLRRSERPLRARTPNSENCNGNSGARDRLRRDRVAYREVSAVTQAQEQTLVDDHLCNLHSRESPTQSSDRNVFQR